MRSILAVVTLSASIAASIAAPLSAVAATPNTFTSPTTTRHQQAEKVVALTLVNFTSCNDVVVIGDKAFKVNYDSVLHVYAPVGSLVTEYSATNSKANGVQLMTVTADDRDKSIFLK
jgi:predicted solute-binding protein